MKRKSNDEERVYLFYAKYHLQLPNYLNFGRYNYMDIYKSVFKSVSKPDVTILKEFYDRWDSRSELSNMLNYIKENSDISKVTIIVWSIFDLNIEDFYTLRECFEIISLLEDESSVDIYDKMVCKFYQLEEACIADPLGDFW